VHARSTTFRGRPESIDQGIAFCRDEVLPMCRELPGCVGLSMIVDRGSGRCIATSSWESLESMRATTTQLQPIRQRAAEILGGTPEVAEWEIAVMHRDHRSADGACARVTWLRGDPAAMDRAADDAIRRFGSLNGWVNNAGIVQMLPATDYTAEIWGREFLVNVQGVVNGAQAACRAFGDRGGAIVNIASNAGKVGFPNMAAYNASKAAVINLTRSLAREWAAKRINVNAVCPGSVATLMLHDVAKTLAAETAKSSEALFAGMVPGQLGRSRSPWASGASRTAGAPKARMPLTARG